MPRAAAAPPEKAPDQADPLHDQPHEDGEACAFACHDHADCKETALSAAKRICAEKGLRLTPVRERTLEILLEGHRAMGAYEVLERLSAEGLGSQPPVAYRALDFLSSAGLVHRIERLNAYLACARPEGAHVPAFLICRICRRVAETEAPLEMQGLEEAAGALGFSIETRVVEAAGLCPDCREAEA